MMLKISEQGLQVICTSEIIVRYQFHKKKRPLLTKPAAAGNQSIAHAQFDIAVSNASLIIQLILMGKRKTHSFQCAFEYDAFGVVYGSNNFIGS